MHSPEVSIIIPIYNVEKYLKRCLDSVVNQTLKNIEIVCIDDESSDNSLNILNEYSKKDERIKVLKIKKSGPSAARNAGMKIATGKYFGFVDSDDWIDEKTYEVALGQYNNDKDIDVVCWGINLVSENKDAVVSEGIKDYFSLKVDGKNELTEPLLLATPVIACDKLFKSEIINKYKITFPYGLLYEDNAFFWKYMAHAKYGYFLKDYFYNYWRRQNSIMGVSSQKKSNKLFDRLYVFEDIYTYYKKIGKLKDNENLMSEVFYSLYYQEYRASACPKKVVKKAQKIVNKFNLKNEKRDAIKKLRRGIDHNMPYYSLREDIFSIKEFDNQQILSILGIKFSIKNSFISKLLTKKDASNCINTKNQSKKFEPPKISVLMPVYNTEEKYLRASIESVLNQTFTNLELIIINDNSSTNVEDIIFSYTDERIIYLKNEVNLTAGGARKEGFNISRGEYIAMVDSDDVAAPSLFEELYNFLSINEDYALVVADNKVIDYMGIICYWDIDRNVVYDINQAFYYSYTDFLMKWATNINFFSDDFGSYQKLLLGNHIPNGYLIRKSIFENFDFYTPDAPLEDYYIMFQIAKHAKMKFIPKPLFYYRSHPNNSIKQKDKFRMIAKMTRRHEMKLVEQSNNPQIKKYMRDYLNSFPKLHILKIPFILEVYKIITPCVEQTKIKLLGFLFVINTKKL